MTIVELNIAGKVLTWSSIGGASSYTIYSSIGIVLSTTPTIFFNVSQYISNGITGFYVTWKDGAGTESDKSSIVWYIPPPILTVSGDSLVWSGSYNELDVDYGSQMQAGSIYYAPTGVIYLGTNTNQIYTYDASGVFSLFVGSPTGAAGFLDGTGTDALFSLPNGIVGDSSMNLYVCDYYNNAIRKIDVYGNVVTIAFNYTNPINITINANGILYFTTTSNVYSLDSKDASFQTILLAGNSTPATAGVQPTDGNGTSVQFCISVGIVTDTSGYVYGMDFMGSGYNVFRLWKLDSSGNVSTLLTTNTQYFNVLSMDAQGYLYCIDYNTSVVYRMNTDGTNVHPVQNLPSPFYIGRFIMSPTTTIQMILLSYLSTGYINFVYTTDIAAFYVVPSIGDATDTSGQSFPLNGSSFYTVTATYNGSSSVPSAYSTGASISGSGLYIVNQDGTYSVAGCSPANATAVTIDTSYNGGAVTTIVDYAFQGNTRITSITMPSVTTIGQYAFASCTGLTTVPMPAVTSLGRNAFGGCSGLSGAISMPSLESIGMEAFFNCIGITSVSVPLLTIIGYGAFSYCAGLQTVYMPSATSIRDGAFFQTSLTSVVIPTTVVNIGSDAFRPAAQSYLTSLTMSGCSFSTSANAFAYNTVLTSVDIPGAVTLGTSMFLGCTSLASVTLGEGITTLPDGVFNTCNLSSIVLPVSLETIGNGVLNGNPFLTTITIPRNVTSIGTQAFVQNDQFGISTIYFECAPPQSYVYLPYISNVYYPSYQSSVWSSYITGWRNSGQIPSSTTFTGYTPSWYTGATAPSAPANLTIVNANTLRWTTVAGSGLYYSVSGNGSLLGSSITSSNGITLCTLVATLYSVTYLSVTVSNFIGSATSSVVYVPPPTIYATTTSPIFQFTPVTNATQYNVYSVVDTSYSLVATTTSTSYTATDSGTAQYVVTAVATVNGISSESVYSNPRTVVFPSTSSTTLSVTSSTVSVVFSPTPGVTYTMAGYAGTQFFTSASLTVDVIASRTYSLQVIGSDGTTTTPAVYVPPPTVTLVNTTLTWPTITSTDSVQYNLYADGAPLFSNITKPYTLSGNAGSTVSFTVTTVALGIESAPSNAILVYFPSVPSLSVVGSLVSWAPSQVDISFDIYVDGSILTTMGATSYTIQSSSLATIYVVARNGAFSSSPSESVYFIPAPVARLSGLSMSWTDVSADSYSVYSASDGQLLQSSSATNYTISGSPGSGLQVSLLVVANSSLGGLSENSNTVSTFFPVKPTGITIRPFVFYVEVAWNTQTDVSYIFYTNRGIYPVETSRGTNSTAVATIATYDLSGIITTMYVVATHNGIFSPSSDIVTYVPIPTDISLNVTTLSWTSLATTNTIRYNVYSLSGLSENSYVLLDSTSSTSYTLTDAGLGGIMKTIVVSAYDETMSAESAFTVPMDVLFPFTPSTGEYGPDVVLAAIQATSNIATVKDVLQNYPDSFSASVLTFSGADVAALVDSFAPGYSRSTLVDMNILLCASGSTVDISSSSLSAGSYLYFPASPGSTLTFTIDGGSPIVITCISATKVIVNGIDVLLGEAFLFNGASYVYIGSGSIVAAPGSSSMPVLSLSGSILTWSSVSGTDISYSVYLITDGTPVFQDSTANTAWDISSSVYSEISIFAITSSVPTYAESMRSNAIIFVPPPSELYITGTTLSWTGPMDVYFTVYGNGDIVQELAGILSLNADISLQSTVSSFYVVANDADGNVSLPSEPVSYAPTPSGLSLKGTLLSWIGPSDVSYTIVVGADRSSPVLYTSETSCSIASAVSDQVVLITIVCVNGYTSDFSAPISYYPPLTSVVLTGTTLSWTDSTGGVTYSIYSSQLDISGVSSTSQDITPYLQSYGPTYFTVVSTDGSSESPPSNAVVYFAAPTDISLNGSVVSWDTIYGYAYNLYIDGSLASSGVVSPINVSTYSDVISVSITAVMNGVESGPSSTVVYVPPPTGPAINGTTLSWSETASNVTFTVLNTGIAGITATSVDISAVTDVTTLSVIAVASDGSLSVPSDSVVYVPAPTDVSLNGTTLTWAWSGSGSQDILYHVYVSSPVGKFFPYSAVSEQSLDVSNLLLDAVSFYVTVETLHIASSSSNTISLVYPPTILSNSGTVLSWSYSVFDVSFLVYADSTLVATLGGSMKSYPTNQGADMTVDYTVSVVYNGIQSENSATYTLVTPAVPSDVDASGSTLVWASTTSSTVTFNIYRVNANGSYTLIGSSSDPSFSIVQYSGIEMLYVVTEVSVSQIESAYSDPPFDYAVPFTGDVSGINGSTFVAAALESTTTAATIKNILQTYQDSFVAPVFTVPVSDTSKLIDISTSAYDPTKPVTIVLCKDGSAIDILASQIQNGELMYFAGVSGAILTYHIIDDISDSSVADSFRYYHDYDMGASQDPGMTTVVVRIDDDSQGVTIAGINYRLNSSGVMIPFGPNGLMVTLVGIGSWVSQTVNSLIYTVSGTSAYLTSLNNSTGLVSIPARFTHPSSGPVASRVTYTVLGISGSGPNGSLLGASLATAISFDPSSTMTTIPSYAFSSCTNLIHVELPSSVQTIGNNAFMGCTKLESITFTSSVNSGFNPPGNANGNAAARSQASIRASLTGQANGVPFTSSTQNSSLTTIGENAFNGCSKLTITDFNQCYNLQTIGGNAFNACTSLCTSFPSSITTISGGAFRGCNGSGYISFSPMSLTTLGSQALYQCVNLSGCLDLSNSTFSSITDQFMLSTAPTTTANWQSFYNSLVTLSGVTAGSVGTLGQSINICGCSLPFRPYTITPPNATNISLTTTLTPEQFALGIVLPLNTLSGASSRISQNVLYAMYANLTGFGFPNLTSIRMSSSITTISGYALNGCLALQSLVFPSNSKLTTVGSYAFANCLSLNVSGTFMNCSGLSIFGNYAFYNCIYMTDVSIPNTLTTISPSTFGGCGSLRNIYISPSSNLTTIGDYAFFTSMGVSYPWRTNLFCSSLRTAQFSNCSKLTYIGSYAFSACNLVCNFPASITDISSYAFDSCPATGMITFPSLALRSIGPRAFSNCASLSGAFDLSRNSTLTRIPSGSADGIFAGVTAIPLRSITIPPSVITPLNTNFLQQCSLLTTLYLDVSSLACLLNNPVLSSRTTFNTVLFKNTSTLTTITNAVPGVSVASSLKHIQYITLPDSVTTIAPNAFSGCTNLIHVTLSPNSLLTTIGDGAFNGCTNLTTISGISSCSQLTTIGYQAFFNCSKLTASFPSNIRDISAQAFRNCRNGPGVLTFAPMNIRSMGTSVFQADGPGSVSNLSNSSFVFLNGSTITSIHGQFAGPFSNLRSITFPDSVTSIGANGLGVPTLQTVIFGSNITTIGNSAFTNCPLISSISFPTNSLMSIGDGAFNNCYYLSMRIPSSVTSIGRYAFWYGGSMSGVITLDPSMSLTYLGRNAFHTCLGLSGSIDLRNCSGLLYLDQFRMNSKFLYENASARKLSTTLCPAATSFTSIILPNSLVSIVGAGDSTFAGNPSYVITALGSNSQYPGFGNCCALQSVSFDTSTNLQTIGHSTFQYCTSLTYFSVPASVVDIWNNAFHGCSGSTTIVFEGLPPVLTNYGSLNTDNPMYGIYPSALEAQWLPHIVGGTFRNLRMRSSQMSIALTPTSLYDISLNIYYDASSSVVFTLSGTPNTTYNIYMNGTSVASQPMTSSIMPITISDVPDGSYNFYATLTDVAGYSVSSATFTIVVMATPPAAPVIDTVTGAHMYNAASSNNMVITLSGQVGTKYQLYELTDGITLTDVMLAPPAPPRRPIKGLRSKPYIFNARLTNDAGLISPLSNTLALTVQLTPPNQPILITTSPQITNISSIPFTVSGDDTATNTTYTIYMDGSSVTNVVASGLMPSSLVADTIAPGILDGSHTFFVTLTDGAGNVSVPSLPLSVQIFTSVPKQPVIALVQPAPPVVVHITNAVTTLNISSVQISISGDVNTTYSLYDDINFCQSGSMVSSDVTTTVSELLDGSHTFYVTLTDEAGNTSVPSLLLQVVTDTTPPDPPVLITMSPSPTNISAISFTISGEALAVFSFYVDGNLHTTDSMSSNGLAFIYVSDLSDGQYSFYAHLTDTAGNIGLDCSDILIVVDTIAPNPPVLITTSPSPTTISSTTITIVGEIGSTYTLYMNGSLNSTGAMNPSGSVSLSELPDGAHIFYATLTDQANNTSDISTLTVVVSTAKPILTTPSPAVTDISSLTFTIYGDVSYNYNLYVDGSLYQTGSMASGPAVVSVVVDADGSYNVYATLLDQAGNEGVPSDTITILVDTAHPLPPTFTPTPSQATETITVSGEVGTSYIITLTDTLTLSGTMVDGGVQYSYTNLLYTQLYTLAATLTDAVENQSIPTTATWTPPFILTVSGNTLMWNGPDASYSVVRVNTDSSTTVIGTPSNPSYDISLYVGITIAYRVYDATNASSNDLTVTLSTLDYSPAAASIPLTEYITAGLQSATLPATLKGLLDNNGIWFSSNLTTISGIDCSVLIEPSQCSINYPVSYFANKVFTFAMIYDNASFQSVDFPVDASSVFYLAIPTSNTSNSISVTIDTDAYTLMADSNSFVVLKGASEHLYSLDSVFAFNALPYTIGAFGCVVCVPYIVYTPTNVSLYGSILSWTGSSADISYIVYDASGPVIVGSTISTTLELAASVYPFATYYIIGISPDGTVTSAPSSSVTYLPSPFNLTASGTELIWTYPANSAYVTFGVFITDGLQYSRIGSTSSNTYNTGQTYGSVIYVVTAEESSSTSVYSNPAIITISSGGGGDGSGSGGFDRVPCFLGTAPVLTPTGYTKISKLSIGDNVMTADGRTVAIKKVSHTRVEAHPSVNPYVIPKGLYSAMNRLLISPNHRVQTDAGLIEAKHLGLSQESMFGSFDYYNLELPDWKNDNMVVAGVVVESLAPVRRITMTMAQFKAQLIAKYGTITPEVLKLVDASCRVLENGYVECPVLPK